MKQVITLCWVLLLSAGCSVMSANMRDQVDATGGFEELVSDMAHSKGAVVILGGYIIELTNQPQKTTLLLLDAPLDIRDKPGSRDRSRGRLIVEYAGFLDPEVFKKDRKVTVGGRIEAGAAEAGEAAPYPFLRIVAEEIHLWPLPKLYYADPPPWWGPPRYYHRWYNGCPPYGPW
jgi:outer membrane lipoprotein